MNQQYFETIKCDDYEVFHLEYHKKRIARTIGLNIELQEYIYPPNEELLKCKVFYDKDGIVDISYSSYTPRDIKTFKLIVDDNIAYQYKSTNREVLNNLFVKKDDKDEIIIIKNGLITDTSIANIAILIDEVWYTPRLPLLHGTTKDRLIVEGKLKELDIDIDTFKKAKNIALMNAMIGFKII